MKKFALLAAGGLISVLPSIASARPHFFFGFVAPIPVPVVAPIVPPVALVAPAPVIVPAPVVPAPVVVVAATPVVAAPVPVVCAPARVVYDYSFGYRHVRFDRGYGWHRDWR